MIKGLRVIRDPGSAEVAANLIGERWEISGASRFLEIRSPVTGQVIGHVQLSGRETAQRAIAAAVGARDKLRRMSVWKRSKLCLSVADALERRKKELARLLTLEQANRSTRKRWTKPSAPALHSATLPNR